MKHIEILSDVEKQKMKKAGTWAARLLRHVGEKVEPGITTLELNEAAEKFGEEHDLKHAPLNYKGFPRSICTSVNNVVCHGIPDDTTLEEGDIVSIDVTPIVEGYHGDTCATFPVGEVREEARHLIETTARGLHKGLAKVEYGNRVGDIGAAIQEYVEEKGLEIVVGYTGHGIGKKFHCDPEIPHHGREGSGLRLKSGMAFTVEPMVNTEHPSTRTLDDGWSVVTKRGGLSAQFEHTIIVEDDHCTVTTKDDGQRFGDPFREFRTGEIFE